MLPCTSTHHLETTVDSPSAPGQVKQVIKIRQLCRKMGRCTTTPRWPQSKNLTDDTRRTSPAKCRPVNAALHVQCPCDSRANTQLLGCTRILDSMQDFGVDSTLHLSSHLRSSISSPQKGHHIIINNLLMSCLLLLGCQNPHRTEGIFFLTTSLSLKEQIFGQGMLHSKISEAKCLH